jgi:hypothetical protein
MFKVAWIVVAILLCPMTARPDEIGYKLFRDCQDWPKHYANDRAKLAYCLDYVDAASKSIMQLQRQLRPPFICLPPDVDAKVMLTLLIRHLQTHQGDLNSDGESILGAALMDAYPCPLTKTR